MAQETTAAVAETNPGTVQHNGSSGRFSNSDRLVRREGHGGVYGVARRKGESNPRHYGLAFRGDLLGHPALIDSRPLPPLGGYPKKK